MEYVPRLKERYREEVVPQLTEQFGYSNRMEVPRLLKISINKGVGDATENKKALDDAVEELRAISGQHPAVSRARKSVSNFKLREGMPIGVHVTLRADRMYDFLDRLVTLALPRVRDFRGIPDRSFDGRGNYTLGIQEQIIFPELDVDSSPLGPFTVTTLSSETLTVTVSASSIGSLPIRDMFLRGYESEYRVESPHQ